MKVHTTMCDTAGKPHMMLPVRHGNMLNSLHVCVDATVEKVEFKRKNFQKYEVQKFFRMACMVCLEPCKTRVCACSYMHRECKQLFEDDCCRICNRKYSKYTELEECLEMKPVVTTVLRNRRMETRTRRKQLTGIVFTVSAFMCAIYPTRNPLTNLILFLENNMYLHMVAAILESSPDIIEAVICVISKEICKRDTYWLKILERGHMYAKKKHNNNACPQNGKP